MDGTSIWEVLEIEVLRVVSGRGREKEREKGGEKAKKYMCIKDLLF